MSWLPKSSVVVPVDFSDEAFSAIEEALQLVADASHLHIIHVLPVLTVAEPGVIWDAVDDVSRCADVRKALAGRLVSEMHQRIDVEVVVGDPGQEIADYAERIGADLITLPSHGRTGLAHLLIGSVAERVIRLAHCPVLVLKRPRS